MGYRRGKMRRVVETLSVLDSMREGLKTYNRRRVRLECGHVVILRFNGRTPQASTGCDECSVAEVAA